MKVYFCHTKASGLTLQGLIEGLASRSLNVNGGKAQQPQRVSMVLDDVEVKGGVRYAVAVVDVYGPVEQPPGRDLDRAVDCGHLLSPTLRPVRRDPAHACDYVQGDYRHTDSCKPLHITIVPAQTDQRQ